MKQTIYQLVKQHFNDIILGIKISFNNKKL